MGVADAPLATMVRALVDETRSCGDSGVLYAESVGSAIAARLVRRFAAREAATEPMGVLTRPRLARVVDKIEASLADAITVDELATVVGVSPAHFAREFKRCTREAPHAFVLRRRLERAQRLLADGRCIAEAAVECGFTDQAHLTRAFKKRYGVTPGAFVRQVRGEPAAPS